MPAFALVLLSTFAAVGIGLIALELWRKLKSRKCEFICVCFDESLPDVKKPDIVIICRTEEERDEAIRRVCESDARTAYIKRM